MKITQLKAENVKRLKAVEITPDGSIVQISGRNGAGKTSVLDSIAYALGGKDTICDAPIRRGEEKAKIVCELDDLIVTRTFTAAGGALTVTNKEGAKYPSPQAMLDKLVGKLSFDPLAFSRMNARQQADTLKSLVGLDFSSIDNHRRAAFDQRTEFNRVVKQLEGQIAGMVECSDVPAEEISVAELVNDLRDAEQVNATIDGVEREHSSQVQFLESIEKQIERLEKELADARKRAEHQRGIIGQTAAKLLTLRRYDVAPIQQKIADADGVNSKVRATKARLKLIEQLATATADAQKLTLRITNLDAQKEAALSEANFPVSGLSFDDNGVLFNTVPFDQASSAEQLRISVAIGLAMNPKLRVILIRDGSLLDSESLQLVGEMAEAHDAQVWIERVSDSGGVGIVIEDGMVQDAQVHEEVAASPAN